MNLLKFGWLKNGFAQIWLAQKWVCSNLAGSKMGLLKFGRLKNGSAQIWVGSKMGLFKFDLLKKVLTPIKLGILNGGMF